MSQFKTDGRNLVINHQRQYGGAVVQWADLPELVTIAADLYRATGGQLRSVSVEGLGPDEVRVIERIVTRLRTGATVYGLLALTTERRDMTIEAGQELLDACVYLTCRCLMLELAQAKQTGG